MKRLLMFAVLIVSAFAPMAYLAAHCEVPCGIYDDQRRFEGMLEDQTTIAKAIAGIQELSSSSDANSQNQLARWVATKETHATNIQHVIAQYFMTQRIKADAEGYVGKLTAAHQVMVAAMKCKQAADPATATVLQTAIVNFHKAYSGTEGSSDKRK